MQINLLKNMSLGNRIALTFIICIAILFALALFGYLTGRWDDAEAQEVPPSKYENRILELEREAIDNAYRHKVEALFTTWLADPTGQPARALNGVRNARKAYIGAMTEIDKRSVKP